MERPIPLRDDTIRRAREARLDQGIHETEVSFNGESDLQKAFIMCDKNPGHDGFIPIEDFSLDAFPESARKQVILDFMKLKARETVRLSCSHTSMNRPDGYTFSHYRGSTMLRLGSGRVWGVHIDKIMSDLPCPFSDCTEVDGPHFVSGFLRIHTAKHVVFDDVEAQKTTVEFFYDTPGDCSTVVKARGVKVVRSDIEGDYCVIDCVTHDPDLCTTLNDVRQQWYSQWNQVKDLMYGQNISIVISHPHGLSKQVSIGKCLEREWGQVDEGQGWYKYDFDAATCPGCSGAPVWVPGSDGLFSGYAPHSGHVGNGVNRSAVWFFWKPSHPAEVSSQLPSQSSHSQE